MFNCSFIGVQSVHDEQVLKITAQSTAWLKIDIFPKTKLKTLSTCTIGLSYMIRIFSVHSSVRLLSLKSKK